MRSMKSRVIRGLTGVSAACAVALAWPTAAHAQGSSNCPPGSWFCGDAGAQAGAGASTSGGASAQGAAGASGSGLQPLPGSEAKGETPAPPPVVVYQPAPPPVVVVQGRSEAPPPYRYTPRPPHKRRSEWGINLRGEGAILGSKSSSQSGMGGLGFGVRYRPVPVVGIEAGLDFFGGRDYNGDNREESSFTLNSLIFVNPKSRAQFYFLAGFGWQGARVTRDTQALDSMGSYENNYSYFGMQGGFGMEFRVAKHFALNLALIGFVRGRTDSDAQNHPEFTDASGRTTNTSGGGVFQGGMTFYW